MPSGIFVLLIAAAVLHAAWNVLLKTAADPLRTAGRGMVAGALVLIPAGTLGWLATGRPPIPPEAWVLAIVSGIVEAIYFSLLSAAYRRGDLSLVYPIARGTGPVVAVAIGVVILGERLGTLGAVGVACLLTGIVVLQRPWAVFRLGSDVPRRTREAVWLAVATGVAIACYSAIDRDGARLVPPWLYAAMLWTFMAIALYGGIAVLAALGRAGSTEPVGWRRPAAGGLMTVAAYLLVLIAYVYAPLSVVAPLRESAIVIVSGWGTIRLREATARRTVLARIGAAGLIVIGGLLLALGE